MNKTDILSILPAIHNIDKKKMKHGENGFSKYQVLKILKLDNSKGNYKKINDCIDMGFLSQVNHNPPEFLPDREKIWKFWNETPIGIEAKKMLEDHAVVLE